MDDAEREQLKTFVDEFAALIGDVLKDEHAHWFPSNLVEPLNQAWANEVSRKIGEIKSAIDQPPHQRALNEEGLTGEQLKLKMAAWRHAHDGARQGPLSRAPRSWWQSVLDEVGLALRALQGGSQDRELDSREHRQGDPPGRCGGGIQADPRRLARPRRRARTPQEARVLGCR
jgi:hypothetical protein